MFTPFKVPAVPGALLLLLALPGLAHAQAAGVCSRTAGLMRAACAEQVRADYATELGRCLNTRSDAARARCLARARQTRGDDVQRCGEQLGARLALCRATGEGRYDPPEFRRPGNFVDPLEIGRSVRPNPFFPLVPGSQWVYRGGGEVTTVEVLAERKVIAGVPCITVHDVVEEDGVVIEDTLDWYAQQEDGTVWYCGELSQELEGGELVSLEGSWRAGRDRARAGVIMEASPRVGDVYRQEFALGEAEDAAEVLSLTGSATVPATSCEGSCLLTRDFTPLEPEAREDKSYAPGVGLVLEVDRETGERNELVRFRIGPAR